VNPLSFAVICPPGLEFVTRQEMAALGINPSAPDPRTSEAGVLEGQGTLENLYALNLHLRSAGRVLVRLGSFNAAAFSELHKKASRLAWKNYLHAGRPVVVRVSTHGSKLYHKKGIAERVLRAASEAIGTEVKAGRVVDDEPEDQSMLVMVRIVRDFCTISIDSSGAHLHRRGYRLASAKAPIRENLAAAMLLATGWPGNAPLVDPFCGSGTIPIEAALIASKIPPGWNRTFAFEAWPGFDAGRWNDVRKQGRPAGSVAVPAIHGSDRDAGAIRAATENAERAGMAERIAWTRQSISDLVLPDVTGWIVTNPPYGERIKGGPDMRNLYARMGSIWRERAKSWNIYLLSGSPRLTGQLGMSCRRVAGFNNGGLPVVLMHVEQNKETR